MQAVCESFLDLLIRHLQKALVGGIQGLPTCRAQGVEHCWKVVRAAVEYLILQTQVIDLVSGHSKVSLQQPLVNNSTFERSNERPKILVSRDLDPLMLVLDEIQHNFSERTFPCGIIADTGHVYDDVNAALADAPVGFIRFLLIEF